jgi:hypothetical protein
MSTLTTTRRRVITLAALLFGSWPAMTQTSGRYTVEIIIFSTGDAAGDLGSNIAAAPAGSVAFTPAATRQLAGTVAKLRGTKGYRVLAHTAWSQSAAAWNSRRGVSAEQLGLDSAGISGVVIVERGQFMHLGIDLKIVDGAHTYRVNQVRRVKPGEPHYFDHPSIGIIAQLSAGG